MEARQQYTMVKVLCIAIQMYSIYSNSIIIINGEIMWYFLNGTSKPLVIVCCVVLFQACDFIYLCSLQNKAVQILQKWTGVSESRFCQHLARKG